jgi:adenylate cyclase
MTNVQERVDTLHTWLHSEAVEYDMEKYDFIRGYCELMRELDVPVDRFFCAAAILHPQVAVKRWVWEFPDKVTEYDFSPEEFASRNEEFVQGNGPLMQMREGAEFVRIRATDDDLPADCQWMIDDNYTELYGLPAPKKGNETKMQGGFTWATKAPTGFTEDQIEFLNKSLLSLTTVVRLRIANYTSKTLLMAYLGEDAGSRVHSGEIQRGDGLVIRSVIWFSDIRGFTKMSGELNRQEILPIINGVFEITDEIVRKHNGQVLKYMGDGCMAIFSHASFQRESFSENQKRDMDDQHGAKLCHDAMLAAAQVQKRLALLKKEREEKALHGVSVGIGLHYGDCIYGNVGAPSRLDFTVIGPHVNLGSRIESLCSKLHADILASQHFKNLSGGCPVAWTSRGEHQVKGVSTPVEVYELNHGLINEWTGGSF